MGNLRAGDIIYSVKEDGKDVNANIPDGMSMDDAEVLLNSAVSV